MHFYVSGYELLREMKFPFASISTLNRWVRDIDFVPGIQEQNFQLLAAQAKTWKPQQKTAIIVCDELGIKAQIQVDPSNQMILGLPTIPPSSSKKAKKVDENQPATKAMVFTIVGLSTRFKVVAAYHFTGNSFCATTVKYIFEAIIMKAKVDCDVTILGTSMDMGPGNMAV